jgi:hypothetical protein
MTFITPPLSDCNIELRLSRADCSIQAIVAELISSNRCHCESHGLTTTGYAPVLAMCRELLRAGADPDMALVVYRNRVVALKVHAIGEAARLTVRSAGNGRPIFALDGRQEGATAPPVRFRLDFDPVEGGRP